jgi:hypothetical protein
MGEQHLDAFAVAARLLERGAGVAAPACSPATRAALSWYTLLAYRAVLRKPRHRSIKIFQVFKFAGCEQFCSDSARSVRV